MAGTNTTNSPACSLCINTLGYALDRSLSTRWAAALINPSGALERIWPRARGFSLHKRKLCTYDEDILNQELNIGGSLAGMRAQLAAPLGYRLRDSI